MAAGDREELEALMRLDALEKRAKGPGANPASQNALDVSGQVLDPSAVGGQGARYTPNPSRFNESLEAQGVLPPQRHTVSEPLSATLKKMGSELDPVSKLGSGIVQSFGRSARAIGLPHAIQALTGREQDIEGKGLEGQAEGTGALGTLGDLVGTGTQVAPVAGAVTAASLRALPRAVLNWADKSRYLAPGLSTAGNAAATTAIMTPGDIGERAKQATIAAAMAVPVNAITRYAAKPAMMSESGAQLRAVTGETPPLHIGAESKLLRDLGDLTKEIPGVGSRMLAGEERVWHKGVEQLWSQATPPGKTSLLTSGADIRRGKLFGDLKDQFDDTYRSLLRGQRIPTTNADRNTVSNLVDRSLVPEDGARLHVILDKYFPKGNYIGGETWKELQETIRSEASKFKGSASRQEQRMGEVLSEIDDHLIKMRNRGVSTATADGLDATDRAYAVRKLLEKAIAQPGGESGLTPKMLSKSVAARTSEAGLARGHGVGQPMADTLAANLGDMGDRSLPSALWGLRRLVAPSLVGGAVGGLPGFAAPTAIGTAMNWIGAGEKGAKVMFGETAVQKKVADFLRKYPQAIPAATSTLDVQAQE